MFNNKENLFRFSHSKSNTFNAVSVDSYELLRASLKGLYVTLLILIMEQLLSSVNAWPTGRRCLDLVWNYKPVPISILTLTEQ